MKRLLFQAFFILFLTGCAGAQPVTLDHLLDVQRGCWSQAWVSSGFYDWRTVSRYRRRAGLHLGYDIAMPYGSPVASAWTGQVVAVTPWTSSEWGVTVRSPEGWEVTYGHISPLVSVGTTVVSGTVVGTIASDHVDVKMKDHSGAYVAFADRAPRKQILPVSAVRSQYHRTSVKLKELEAQIATLRIEVSRQNGRQSALEIKLKKARELARKGLLSERELQTLENARETCPKETESPSYKLKKLQKELQQLNTNLAALTTEARSRNIPLAPPSAAATPEPDNEPLEHLLTRGLISNRELEARKIGDSLP